MNEDFLKKYNLPIVNFAEKSTEKVMNEIVKVYEATTKRILAPGDPVRLFLYSIALLIVGQRTIIDYSAKQNLLAYAEGEYLDNIGAFLGVTRLQAEAAQTTLKFNLSDKQQQVVTIPQGTRATAGNNVFFSTMFPASINAGNLSVEVIAECDVKGKIGNAWLPGQINQIVDPFPFFGTVANTTESKGGSEVESDTAFKERIREVPSSFSVAGPERAYHYWAKSAHVLISDVHVYSPKPGEVEIRPLLQGGEIPTPEILDDVFKKCNDKTVRPLTDKVAVLAPTVVKYDINFDFWISTANATIAADIEKQVKKAVEAYINWQKGKMGRDVNPSELIKMIMEAGAKRIEVSEPKYIKLDQWKVSIATKNIAVNYKGLEDG